MIAKTGIENMFNNLIFAADDLITVPTATLLAKELGIEFSAEDFDH